MDKETDSRTRWSKRACCSNVYFISICINEQTKLNHSSLVKHYPNWTNASGDWGHDGCLLMTATRQSRTMRYEYIEQTVPARLRLSPHNQLTRSSQGRSTANSWSFDSTIYSARRCKCQTCHRDFRYRSTRTYLYNGTTPRVVRVPVFFLLIVSGANCFLSSFEVFKVVIGT